MFRLLEFIRSIYVVALFIIAEGVAISYYARSNSYTQAKIFVVSNSVVGGVSGVLHNTGRLFELSGENRMLAERIAQLESQLATYSHDTPAAEQVGEVIFDDPEYTYIVGRVISNSINKHDNFFVIDKGITDGVYEKMAVITPMGEMLGYVAGCTNRYCAALSILSDKFTTSGKIKDGTNYGSISWGGNNRYKVSMNELSKYENINLGDTIVSTGFSNIFPGGVTIGTVDSFELNEMQTAYNVEINLAAHLTAIDYVLLVGSRDSAEVDELLNMMQTGY